ncbi:MAG: LamG-like jellyroll fold domain-containing protein [Bacteroidales bacterium]
MCQTRELFVAKLLGREPDWNNKWIHVAGVYSGKSLKLYINGKLKKELA